MLQQLLLLVNLVFAMLLIMSYFAGNVSPADSWVLPFIGLAYPFLLLINIAFAIYWALMAKFYFLLSALVILAGFDFTGRYFQAGNAGPELDPEKSFKILSFNVHNLTENNYNKLTERQNDIFDHVINEAPDIICMQEFYSQGENYYYPLINLKEKLNARNYYYESYYNPYKSKIVGMAIFSKFERIDHGFLKGKSDKKFGIFADLVHQGDTFRVYNLHLESIYLQSTDYKVVTGNTEELGKEGPMSRLRRISGKLKQAFKNRSKQVERVRQEIEACPYPVIICGDFNDTPTSYAYNTLTENLEDAFIESGSGLGQTFSSRIPFFRIDYILYDKRFISADYAADNPEISDHFPVSCFLSLEN
ncbi:MAG: endonuclease/exonuclease/phosphatase family protein [Bacteroidota bacterium]|nr:endonuclease/exonuclease/phosphatase family protein [Bacteroidota bacterium]